ncbi:GNAT family N-acetyltransferase [Embleya sp. MST-111070]|uniref:GNAT family N-acetyltransferase n=1 Tax=Embleya sp. MST-111070 TaxID=3398231 RepID=UPI003F736DDB
MSDTGSGNSHSKNLRASPQVRLRKAPVMKTTRLGLRTPALPPAEAGLAAPAQSTDEWAGPDRGRVRFIRADEADAADDLLGAAGVTLDPWHRKALVTGTLCSTVMTGLDRRDGVLPLHAAAAGAGHRPWEERLPALSVVLVAEDSSGQVVGTVVGMPSPTLLAMSLQAGESRQAQIRLTSGIAKLHGLAVCEPARGTGWGTALLRAVRHVYVTLGFRLVYGQFETARALGPFYAARGFEVLAPGATLRVDAAGAKVLRPGRGEQFIAQPLSRRGVATGAVLTPHL